MAGYRMDRTSEDIKRELTAIIRTVKDPRVADKLLSVVRVEVSRDMSYATVYVSAMEGIDTARAAVEGCKSAAGFMRHALGEALRLRHVPALRFVADDSIAYSARIAQTLAGLDLPEDPAEDTP
ncbi:MAG: 30S ribosome-binding factor RbfA [Acutalibacteraceae bacterium]|jgi:ribosome-binding factor A